MPYIQKVNLFSTTSADSPRSFPSFQLMLQGLSTGRRLKGRKLVDQYMFGDRYVLLASNDNANEEVLHIYLLDTELNVVDEMSLSQPYTPGIYEPWRNSGRHLEFRFFNEGSWCLEIRQTPKNAPLNNDQYPVNRPLKLWGKQYLNLARVNPEVA